ncbi:MAG: hypothetical protein MUC50_23225 [Myxococcota bacterium]|nr:hypothetical protein [Myxococcota bacterium]
MSSTPKEKAPPVAEDELVEDMSELVSDSLAPLGDFNDEDEVESLLEFDFGAMMGEEPRVAPLPSPKGGRSAKVTLASSKAASAPLQSAQQAEEDLPSLDDDWGLEEPKMGEQRTEDAQSLENEVPLDLDAELDFEEQEPVLDSPISELPHDVAEQLGMELFVEEAVSHVPPKVDAPPSFLLDAVFLGPVDGRGCAAAFLGGEPVVVGEGLFALGADGLLHETPGSARLAVAEASSVFVHGRSLFVGTEHGGLFVTRDMGQSLRTLNSWIGQGLTPGQGNTLGSVPTSFRVLGQKCSTGPRLLGLTGEGELLMTSAPELGWQGPFGLGRCVAVCTVHGTDEVLIVASAPDGTARLLATKDFDHIETRQLPPGVENHVGRSPLVLAANSNAVLCGVDAPGQCAFSSDDGGCTWRALSHLGRPTAVLVDADDPAFSVVASWYDDHGMGALHVSEDEGQRFRTALLTGKGPGLSGVDAAHHRIRALCLHLGRTRRMLAVTHAGTFLLTFATAESAH